MTAWKIPFKTIRHSPIKHDELKNKMYDRFAIEPRKSPEKLVKIMYEITADQITISAKIR